MKLITIYNVPNGGHRVDIEEIEDNLPEEEITYIKREIVDECAQRFMQAIVLEESDAIDVMKQLNQKLGNEE